MILMNLINLMNLLILCKYKPFIKEILYTIINKNTIIPT